MCVTVPHFPCSLIWIFDNLFFHSNVDGFLELLLNNTTMNTLCTCFGSIYMYAFLLGVELLGDSVCMCLFSGYIVKLFYKQITSIYTLSRDVWEFHMLMNAWNHQSFLFNHCVGYVMISNYLIIFLISLNCNDVSTLL